MPIINGLDRHQLTFSSLEAAIATDNEVRLKYYPFSVPQLG